MGRGTGSEAVSWREWACEHCGRPEEPRRVVVIWRHPTKWGHGFASILPPTEIIRVMTHTWDQQHGARDKIAHEFCGPICHHMWQKVEERVGNAEETIRSEFSRAHLGLSR